MSATPSPRMPGDLLARGPLGRLMRSRWYPAAFQWAGGAFFVLIVWQLMLGPAGAHDNLGTALVWVVWWPLLPLAFIALGRVWCAVCPFGWLSDAVQRLAGLHLAVPRLLERHGIWVIDGVFVLVTWADHVWGIVGSPFGSGALLLLVATSVVLMGAVYERRAFCRFVCFLGGVAGNYSRTGMVALRATPEVCAACTHRAACYNGGPAAPACPMGIFPRTMETSAECTLCAHCVKNCPSGSLTLTVRPPGRELWFIRRPRLAESMLAVVIMGIVFIQNVTMLGFWGDVESWLQRATGTTNDGVVYTVVFVAAIGATLGLVAAASAVAGRASGEGVWDGIARFGYALIPLDVAGHLAHNLFHLLAEGKSVVFTAFALVGVHREGSAALVGNGAIRVAQYALVAVGLALSLYTAHRIARRPGADPTVARRSMAPYGVLLVLLAAVNVVLFALPMAHRM